MTTGPRMTLAQALAEGAARLRAAGIEAPEGDMRRLAAHAMGTEPGRLPLIMHEALPEAAASTLFDVLLPQRAARRPVAQITGRRAFYGHEFLVTPDVLDPRPETETLVALALEAPFARVLDLGTGSGCILLSLLAAMPGATGEGFDISPAALETAAANARALGLQGRAHFEVSDWFAAARGPYDLIVSNPPYITSAEMETLSPEVLHEPRGALWGGADGLDPYRVICAGAPQYLAPGGRLLLETGHLQGPDVAALVRAAGLHDVQIHKDLSGHDRVVSAQAAP